MPLHMICGATLSLSLLTACGCSMMDPYERAGMWHPRGVNDADLAAIVADPHDLVSGKESTVGDGILAAAAVDRLHRDKVKDLPASMISAVQASGSSSSSGSASGSSSGSE